jgi:hypothetical protein
MPGGPALARIPRSVMDVGVISAARKWDVVRSCGSDGREGCGRVVWSARKGRGGRKEWSVDSGSVVVVGCLVVVIRVDVGRRHGLVRNCRKRSRDCGGKTVFICRK